MRKFPEKEALILSYAQFDADAAVSTIARRSGVKPHTARYVIEKYLSDGKLVPIPIVNFTRLGFAQYLLDLSIVVGSATQRAALLKFLHDSERILWLVEVTGDSQYQMAFLARHPIEVQEFLEEALKKFPSLATKWHLTILTGEVFLGRRYWTHKPFDHRPIEIECALSGCQFDSTDHEVIRRLHERISPKPRKDRLHRVSLPDSTVNYRLRTLRERGVLVGTRYTIRHLFEGIQQFRVCLIGVERNRKFESALTKWLLNHRNAVWFMRGLGRWDYQISLEIPSGEELSTFLSELISAFGERGIQVVAQSMTRVIKSRSYHFQTFAALGYSDSLLS